MKGKSFAPEESQPASSLQFLPCQPAPASTNEHKTRCTKKEKSFYLVLLWLCWLKNWLPYVKEKAETDDSSGVVAVLRLEKTKPNNSVKKKKKKKEKKIKNKISQ